MQSWMFCELKTFVAASGGQHLQTGICRFGVTVAAAANLKDQGHTTVAQLLISVLRFETLKAFKNPEDANAMAPPPVIKSPVP